MEITNVKSMIDVITRNYIKKMVSGNKELQDDIDHIATEIVTFKMKWGLPIELAQFIDEYKIK